MSLNLFGIKISRWSELAEAAFFEGMGLMRTDRTDEEIRDAIVSAANGDTSAIAEALTQVDEMQREPSSYVTDRALRIFTAAVYGGTVPGVDSDHAELYEREKRLESLPRNVAVAELCELSPVVRQYCKYVLQNKRSRYRKAGWLRSLLVEQGMEKEVEALVGPESGAREPLLRSPITSGVVMSWVRDEVGLTRADSR